MMIQSCVNRREHLRELMRQRGLAALLVRYAANRYYLSGFELHDSQLNESAGSLIIMEDGNDWICTDSRYLDAARRLWEPDRILIYGADAPRDIARHLNTLLAGSQKTITVGFEAGAVSVLFYEAFTESLSGITPERADGLVEELRIIKDADEIARMEASCALNRQLMNWVPGVLVPGRSEVDIAWDIEQFFRQFGASELAFASIVARGPNAALPHCIPSRTEILGENDLVLIDVGARLNDYCSDQTRTFWVGDKPTDIFQRTLDTVQEAQRLAIEAIRPGVRACDAYQVARSSFERMHVAEAFTHSLGHGIGLETHEGPSLNSRNQTELKPGMIITVEPGLYYPEWGGVRWEDMVLVTESGCRIL